MIASLANVYAVILAAGASTRLGSPKQLLQWHGTPLLTHAVDTANRLLADRVVVVLGAYADTIQAAVELKKVKVIHNTHWQEGLASSIRAGIKALPKTADAALLLLCDQPLIEPEQLRRLLNAWQKEPARIVASHYHNSVGVPALFPVSYFERLLKLNGDRGAKALLLEHRQTLIELTLKQAELDIDYIKDFNQLSEHTMPRSEP